LPDVGSKNFGSPYARTNRRPDNVDHVSDAAVRNSTISATGAEAGSDHNSSPLNPRRTSRSNEPVGATTSASPPARGPGSPGAAATGRAVDNNNGTNPNNPRQTAPTTERRITKRNTTIYDPSFFACLETYAHNPRSTTILLADVEILWV